MTTQATHKLLTLRSVAEQLDVSIKTVRRWVARGELPAFKMGHQWRIHPEDLERFLWRHRHAPTGNAVQ